MTEAVRRYAAGAAVGVTLPLLLAHALVYRFLCDDAFIAFRYARNLARGDGLVFNPGLEPVEGYTNFLWVLVLAALDAVGLPPEATANLLSIGLTVVLWGLVAMWSWRERNGGAVWLCAIAPLYLAATRSVAVWSSGGLETRLFEVLVVAAILRAIVELRAGLDGVARHPLAAVLFALATLTRPDGLQLAACVLGSVAAILAWKRRIDLSWLLRTAAIYVVPVGAHFVWRRAYYGDWLPNTYYAKVSGRTWWDAGFDYVAGFGLEYAAYLWVPLLVAAVLAHIRRGTVYVPALFAAALLPHALFVVSIGGDHFEYRPFDLYFPFVFLMIQDGARGFMRGGWRVAAGSAWLVAILAGLLVLPYRTHAQFPPGYHSGYPGMFAATQAVDYLASGRWLAAAHRERLMAMTRRFVGLRQEEHASLLPLVAAEGRKLRELVRSGVLPADTHIAIDLAGAVPYYSDLRTLDRLGLTDREIGHAPAHRRALLAHDKYADFDYARQRGVDLWALDNLHLVWHIANPAFVRKLWRAAAARVPGYHADLGGGYYLLCRLPQGAEAAAERFGRLTFHPLDDRQAMARLFEAAAAAYRSELGGDGDSLELRVALGQVLSSLGRTDEAISTYEETLRLDPEHAQARNDLGVALAGRGDFEGAAAQFERAVRSRPAVANFHYNLALALERLGRHDEARKSYGESARLGGPER